MSLEEFRLMPRRLGWKYEYWDGEAHVRPNYMVAVCSLPLDGPRSAPPLPLAPVQPDMAEALTRLFYEAFQETTEYCDWPLDQVWESGRKCVEGYFSGRRSEPLPVSCVYQEKGALLAAALFTRPLRGPLLDVLFVHPSAHGQGLATALVSQAARQLQERGERVLHSTYHVANEPSRRWHHRFGFGDEPDLQITESRLHLAEYEIYRRELAGSLSAAEKGILQAEVDRLAEQVQRLRDLARREGEHAVTPLLDFLRPL
jgi:GNAT superfamily N-acetyltransferase